MLRLAFVRPDLELQLKLVIQSSQTRCILLVALRPRFCFRDHFNRLILMCELRSCMQQKQTTDSGFLISETRVKLMLMTYSHPSARREDLHDMLVQAFHSCHRAHAALQQ